MVEKEEGDYDREVKYVLRLRQYLSYLMRNYFEDCFS